MAKEDKQFTKTDMERMGIFKEMDYITIKDNYKGASQNAFNDAAGKGKQMLPGGSKLPCALQHGYFNDKFHRILEGEAYNDPIKLRRQQRLKEAQRNLGKPFLPSNGDKKMSGLGGHYGTIAGNVSAFSPVARPGKPYKAPGKNLYTNPGKRGTGFGYPGLSIGPDPKYTGNIYDQYKVDWKKENQNHRQALKGGAFRLNMHPQSYFDGNPYRSDKPLGPPKKEGSTVKDIKPFKPSSPAKAPGGSKAGTFDPYPSHSVDGYQRMKGRPVHVVNKTGKLFVPNQGPKSAPVNSIVNYNVIKSINRNNFKTLSSVMSF